MNIGTLLQAPLFVPQALWVAWRATRLPEASGERSGEIGQGRSISILILGDSSAAGVGVDRQVDALGGRLSIELAKRFRVKWQVVARSGGTVRSTLEKIETLPPQKFDFVVVALGVNDTKNGVSYGSWQSGYARLVERLSDKFDAPRICISGMPPVRHLPILPRPLNDVLGARAEKFDEVLRRIPATYPQTVYLPFDFAMDASKMASDNLHPGAEIYHQWAVRASEVFDDAGCGHEA